MPRMLAKFTRGKKSWYMEWSTVVDAPVTWGMSLKEFKAYYGQQYGLDGERDLQERLDRCDAKGTSSMMDSSVEELIECNRAGKGETRLTKKQIIDYYCIKRPEDEKKNPPPRGKDWSDE